MQEFEIYVFHQNTNFCFMINWIFLLNISHCWTTISRFIIHVFVICIQTNLKQLFFHFIDSIKKSFCDLSHLNLNVLFTLNEAYRWMNHMIDLLFICLNEYLNKSQLKTNFNINDFFYTIQIHEYKRSCAPRMSILFNHRVATL